MRSRAFPQLIALLTFLAFQPASQILGQDLRDSPPTSAQDSQLEAWEAKLFRKYKKLLVPALRDESSGCIDCHTSQSMSNLVLTGNDLQDFRHMLDNGYLNKVGPDTLLGRVASANQDRRMPKDAPDWSDGSIRKLRKLANFVATESSNLGEAPDERFPRSLLAEYPAADSPTQPTQFLTYRQLKARIKSVFDDDWVRGSEDKFKTHIAAFGGADFETRFNESSSPSPAYLSALESLAREVSSRAIRQRCGPFEDFPIELLSLEEASTSASLQQDAPQQASTQQKAIQHLYAAILGRQASPEEVEASVSLLDQVRAFDESIASRNSELKFELTVTDPATNLSAQKTITLPISGTRQFVRQTLIDQSTKLDNRPPSVLPQMLGRVLTPFSWNLIKQARSDDLPDSVGQSHIGTVALGPEQSASVTIYNQGTSRNVTFAGILLTSLDSPSTTRIPVDSDLVELEGAWQFEQSEGIKYLDDKNQHKGNSQIRINLTAETAGQFDVTCLWHLRDSNAKAVLAELHADTLMSPGSQLASTFTDSERGLGSANFHYDCGNDSVPYFEVPGQYQFSESDFVRIKNSGTFARVTAGAVEFVNANDHKRKFLIDSVDAAGSEAWQAYSEGSFRAYNVRGKKLHDENKNKGKLELTYVLKSEALKDWKSDDFYKVRVYYPGKRDHEPQVPVELQAKMSSPIIQVNHPRIAKSDAEVVLDATSSFTVQQSELQFQWKQVSGPVIEVKQWDQPKLSFSAPRQNAREMAWIALSSALVRHPDFLFTGSISAKAGTSAAANRSRLHKIALDLVGRPPTESELRDLSAGKSVAEFVDSYLKTEDFRDFYFHRVRLYLESQGTTSQDEPARIWSYIAFNDRPFQEILTGDYTVDESFNKQERPAYHGRTGVLTTKGFIEGKPGLPHYNYAAQVTMLFLGYIYEVPPEIVEQREGVTALGTTDPNSSCYSCHKILTPLAFQRLHWTDAGEYRKLDEAGDPLDASDRAAVAEYPFKGEGLEAFAQQAVKKERFTRTILNTHVNFYFGRPLRFREDERRLYKQLWDAAHASNFSIREVIRTILLSPEYLGTNLSENQLAVRP